MQTTTVKTSPAPNPLPSTWLRAIANSITAEFRRIKKSTGQSGWSITTETRAWHPTGAPRGNGLSTTGVIPRSNLLSNTEVISATKYLAGSISPEEHPRLHLPPILWELEEFPAMGALAERPDLWTPLDSLMNKRRRDLPFRERFNRHGNPVMGAGDMSTPEEREAIQLFASAATVVTMNEVDYADGIARDFNGEAVLNWLRDQTG